MNHVASPSRASISLVDCCRWKRDGEVETVVLAFLKKMRERREKRSSNLLYIGRSAIDKVTPHQTLDTRTGVNE